MHFASRRRRADARAPVVVLLSLLSLSASPPALGAGAEKKPRIAVLDVRASGALDAKAVGGISAYLATELSRPPFQVIAAGDIVAALGFEKQKTLLGCSDNECLAQIAGALGVDFLVVPEVSEIGGAWLLNIVVLDAAHAQPVARVTRRASSQVGIVDAVPEAAAALMAPVREKLGLPAAPAAATALAAGGQVQTKSMGSKRIAGIVLDCAAVLVLAGGAVFDGLAVADNNSAKALDARGATDRAPFDAKIRDFHTKGIVSDVLYGVGAAAAVAGIVLTALPDSSPEKPRAALAPMPGGAALVVSGGF
jgi:hypothetical protein